MTVFASIPAPGQQEGPTRICPRLGIKGPLYVRRWARCTAEVLSTASRKNILFISVPSKTRDNASSL